MSQLVSITLPDEREFKPEDYLFPIRTNIGRALFRCDLLWPSFASLETRTYMAARPARWRAVLRARGFSPGIIRLIAALRRRR